MPIIKVNVTLSVNFIKQSNEKEDIKKNMKLATVHLVIFIYKNQFARKM